MKWSWQHIPFSGHFLCTKYGKKHVMWSCLIISKDLWVICQYISCSGSYNKTPQTPWLKQELTLHSSGSWEVQDQRLGQVGFMLSSFLLAWRQLPSLCPHMVGGQRESSLVSLLIKTLILLDQGPFLTTSFKLKYLLTPNIVTLGVCVSEYEFDRNMHSAHKSQ